jgi:hypothetical protein
MNREKQHIKFEDAGKLTINLKIQLFITTILTFHN